MPIYVSCKAPNRIRSITPLVADDSPRTWIHLAYEGEWKGHPAGGFAFDQSVFKQILANFTKAVPLTYEHPTKDNGQPVPAAGWIHELEIRGTDLWGMVELTDRAAEMVRAGEMRFCSVVVAFESIEATSGKDIGAELFECGLTNTPFLEDQTPIRLARHPRRIAASKPARGARRLAIMDPTEPLAAVMGALGLEPGASLEDVQAALATAFESITPAEEAPEPELAVEPAPEEEPAALADEEPEEEAPEMEPAEEGGDATIKEDLAMLLESALEMDLPSILALFQQRQGELKSILMDEAPPAEASAAADDVTTVANSRIAALSKQAADHADRVTELEAELAKLTEAATARTVDDAIALGKILDTDRDTMIDLCQRAPDLYEKMVNKAPAVPTGKIVSASKDAGPDLYEIDTESEAYQAMDRNMKHIIKDKDARAAKVSSALRALHRKAAKA